MSRGKTILKPCETCGNLFHALLKETRHGHGRFCSRKCRHVVPLETRFERHIGQVTQDGCVLWSGHLDKDGYGIINSGGSGGKLLRAHRVAYQLKYGSIDKGSHILHTCDNRACVNVDHLFIGDQATNNRDMTVKKRNVKGIAVWRAKLDPEKVSLCRQKYSEGASISQLASQFSVTNRTMSAAIFRQSWKHVN